MDWITHTVGIMSTILTRNGEMIGYLRYAQDKPNEPKLFLAKYKAGTLVMLTDLV